MQLQLRCIDRPSTLHSPTASHLLPVCRSHATSAITCTAAEHAQMNVQLLLLLLLGHQWHATRANHIPSQVQSPHLQLLLCGTNSSLSP